MENRIGRRDFLKKSAIKGAALLFGVGIVDSIRTYRGVKHADQVLQESGINSPSGEELDQVYNFESEVSNQVSKGNFQEAEALLNSDRAIQTQSTLAQDERYREAYRRVGPSDLRVSTDVLTSVIGFSTLVLAVGGKEMLRDAIRAFQPDR